MAADLSLESFTALDQVENLSTYVAALVAFDAIGQLQELKQIARALLRPGESVLDVGCGFGLESLRLAGRAGRVCGIDKSAGFIAEAQRRAAAEGLTIDFCVGDAAALPYDDAHFDAARAERLLIYLQEPGRAVEEMRRVVRRGGSLAFIEPEFGSTTVNLPDRALVRRVMAHEADRAVVHSALPGALAHWLTELGLGDIKVDTRVVIFPSDLAAEYFSDSGRNAARDGTISTAECEAWLAGIDALHRKAQLFGTVGYFLFTARV